MGKYKVVAGQTLYDVALHLYGSIEGITDLMVSNPTLSLDETLLAGRELTYSDDFMIDEDVVTWYKNRSLTPANGERGVYPKAPTLPPLAEVRVAKEVLNVGLSLSGSGTIEVDWGDNSPMQVILLNFQTTEVRHTFDNAVSGFRRIRLFGVPDLRELDLSAMQLHALYLFGHLPVESFIMRDSNVDLSFAPLLKGVRSMDLRGTITSDLLPLVENHALATLDLGTSSLKRDAVDGYLFSLVERYYERRSCHVTLDVVPSGEYREPLRDANGRYLLRTGMGAVWVLTHEQSWNEASPWVFIIGGKEYSYTKPSNV